MVMASAMSFCKNSYDFAISDLVVMPRPDVG